MSLALIGALDELGDPPAGLYSMMFQGHVFVPGAFMFRQLPGERPTAGLRVTPISRLGRSLRQIVNDDATVISGNAIAVSRGRLRLPVGTIRFLEWEQPIRWGSIHMRAYFLELQGAVVRIEVGTNGAPGHALAAELHRILESARPSGG
jgi:hypothetical protein